MENIDSLETQYGQISENTTPSLTRPSLQWLGPFSMGLYNNNEENY
jgi:hypothetical protein